jgi:hypothetical protein
MEHLPGAPIKSRLLGLSAFIRLENLASDERSCIFGLLFRRKKVL